MSEPTRILIVDDSALYRQTISNVLRDAADVVIVGIAKDGHEALEKIESLDPDLLTLDVQMPDLDGIGVLREITKRRLRPKAIMVSSLTSEGAQITTDALLEGAFDFILKPAGPDAAENRKALVDALEEKIDGFRQSLGRRRPPSGAAVRKPDVETAPPTGMTCRAVLFGTSTGGPAALKAVLPALPADFPVPVLVVQHMPARYTESLAKRLDESCALEVAEADTGMEVVAGRVLIAPGGRQTRLVRGGDDIRIRVTDDPPEHGCRPSVDYLLRSAVDAYDGEALGVIMTGMGRDGQLGCELLKARGGYVFAQHEEGCTVYGMPKAVVEQGLADRIVPLEMIGSSVVRHVRSGRRTRQETPAP
jgi:two-component system chemotaxis response regulator CheB